jgi:hypothetical protein
VAHLYFNYIGERLMIIKTYIVRAKTNPDIFYEVDAPCKWIAKWCGANLANWEYPGNRIAKDMSARREH